MTIKAITATVAIVTFLAADGAVQAEQIKGQHVSSDNGHTIVTALMVVYGTNHRQVRQR